MHWQHFACSNKVVQCISIWCNWIDRQCRRLLIHQNVWN